MTREDLNEDNTTEIMELYKSYENMELDDFLAELVPCAECGVYDLDENMTYYEIDFGETEEKICQGCYEDTRITDNDAIDDSFKGER